MRPSQLFLKSRGFKSQLMFLIYCFYMCETCQCSSYLDWWFAITHIYNFVAYQFYVFVQSTDASLYLNLCIWWEVRLYKLSHYYLVMPYGVSNFCRCRFRKYSVAPITFANADLLQAGPQEHSTEIVNFFHRMRLKMSSAKFCHYVQVSFDPSWQQP